MFGCTAELGDYDARRHSIGYVSEFRLLPNQSRELENRVTELHQQLRGMSPSAAELNYLDKVKWHDMYGVDLHPVLVCFTFVFFSFSSRSLFLSLSQSFGAHPHGILFIWSSDGGYIWFVSSRNCWLAWNEFAIYFLAILPQSLCVLWTLSHSRSHHIDIIRMHGCFACIPCSSSNRVNISKMSTNWNATQTPVLLIEWLADRPALRSGKTKS